MFALHRYYKYYQKLEPAFKNRKTQAYLMAVLSLMTISFFGFFAIRPTLKTIAVLQRQIIDRKTLNEKLDEKINALILAQDEYRLIEADLPLIYTLLPEKPEFPLLMRLLENLTIQTSATISGIQFDPIVLYEKSPPETETATETKDTAADETIPMFFTLSFQGKYQNLINLLDQLTRLERLITINSVDLSVAKLADEMSELKLGIQSRSYYYPESL